MDSEPGNAPPEKQVHIFDFDDTLGVTDNPNGVIPYKDGTPLLKTKADAEKWITSKGLNTELLKPYNKDSTIEWVENKGCFAIYFTSKGLAHLQSSEKTPEYKGTQRVCGTDKEDEVFGKGDFLLIDFTPSSFVDNDTTKPISQTIKKLKSVNQNGSKSMVLTARRGEGKSKSFDGDEVEVTNSKDIKSFLNSQGTDTTHGVVGVIGSDKGKVIKDKFDKENPEEIHFYDDLSKNTTQVSNALASDDAEVYIYGPGDFEKDKNLATEPTKKLSKAKS